jgi:protein-tyrosine phosphatase
MSMILDNLYLGDEPDAFSLAFMKERPTAVINCAKELDKSPHCVAYLHIRLDDENEERLAPHLTRANEFIDDHLANGNRVLVHCYAGVSRSASIVIGYLMYSRGMTFDVARAYVKSKRKTIKPNLGFVRQLHAYGKALAAARV